MKQQRPKPAETAPIPPLDSTAVAFNRLREAGFDTPAARAMASKYPLDQIDRQLGWIDHRRITSNRLGMLRAAIKQDWSAPATRRGQLGRPNYADRDRGASFTDALQQAQRRMSNRHPSSPTP